MERGFSLVESLVVVVLLGLMLSLAVPELQKGLARSQVQAAAQAFVRDMTWARSEALKRSMRIGVCTSSNGLVCGAQGWAGGWLVFVDDNGNGLLDGQDELLRTQSALHGVLSMREQQPQQRQVAVCVSKPRRGARCSAKLVGEVASGRAAKAGVCVHAGTCCFTT